MNSGILKVVLFAGAGYLIYRYLGTAGYLGAATTSATTPTTPSTPSTSTTPVTTTQPTTVTPIVPSVTPAKIAASLLAVPGFSYWGVNGEGGNAQGAYHWNYYWQLSSLYDGRYAGPDELGVDPNLQMTLEQYSQRVYNALFAGLSGLGSIGAFVSAWAN